MSGIKRRAIESPGASIPIPGGLKLRPVKNWGTFCTEIGGNEYSFNIPMAQFIILSKAF